MDSYHPYERAADDVLVERHRLAEVVATELTNAGLPAIVSNRSASPGFRIEVDPGSDRGGGVYVEWQVVTALDDEVVDAMKSGDYDHPATARSYSIAIHMRTAALAILRDAGFEAAAPDDEYRPTALQVVSPRGSSNC